MATWLLPQAEMISMLADFVTDLTLGTVHLFKEDFTITPLTVQADLAAIEADFSGYVAPVIATPTGPYPDVDRGGVTIYLPTNTFTVADPATVGNLIYGGWFRAIAVGTKLVLPFKFSAPVPMTYALTELNLVAFLNFWNNGGPYQTTLNVIVNGIPK